MKNQKNKLPKSATVGWICFSGLIGFMISLHYIKQHSFENNVSAIIAGLSYIVPIIFLEWVFLKIYKRPSTGLNFKKKNVANFERVLIKLVGLYATLSLVALLYWLFPTYHSPDFSAYWILVKYLLLIIVFGSIPYFFILDRYLIEPETSYWKVGMIVTGNWKEINKEGLKNHFLGWLVKAFFLP